jgi:hypothetical protein
VRRESRTGCGFRIRVAPLLSASPLHANEAEPLVGQRGRALGQDVVLGEVGEQEMKIDEPGKWLPFAHGGLNAGVVERLAAVEPTREVVAGADVVPRKDVQPAQPRRSA